MTAGVRPIRSASGAAVLRDVPAPLGGAAVSRGGAAVPAAGARDGLGTMPVLVDDMTSGVRRRVGWHVALEIEVHRAGPTSPQSSGGHPGVTLPTVDHADDDPRPPGADLDRRTSLRSADPGKRTRIVPRIGGFDAANRSACSTQGRDRRVRQAPPRPQDRGVSSVPRSRRKRSISEIRSSPDGRRASSTIDSRRST